MNSKDELRKILKAQAKHLPPSAAAPQSEKVCRQILNLPQFLSAQVVLLYYPLPDEIDCRKVLKEAIALGKTVLLPRVKGNDLELLRYQGESHLREGAFHIQEPNGDALFTDLGKIDFILVPGMAFTIDGCRLGRGKGYYDRFLTQTLQAYKVGICFDYQLVAQLPTESHDVKMNKVIAP